MLLAHEIRTVLTQPAGFAVESFSRWRVLYQHLAYARHGALER